MPIADEQWTVRGVKSYFVVRDEETVHHYDNHPVNTRCQTNTGLMRAQRH